VQAAQHLGFSQVPVLVLDHLAPPQRRAYVIADNKPAPNAGWEDELLASELMGATSCILFRRCASAASTELAYGIDAGGHSCLGCFARLRQLGMGKWEIFDSESQRRCVDERRIKPSLGNPFECYHVPRDPGFELYMADTYRFQFFATHHRDHALTPAFCCVG
jgi:hypothetical protein